MFLSSSARLRLLLLFFFAAPHTIVVGRSRTEPSFCSTSRPSSCALTAWWSRRQPETKTVTVTRTEGNHQVSLLAWFSAVDESTRQSASSATTSGTSALKGTTVRGAIEHGAEGVR
jgi:hypothetical protein